MALSTSDGAVTARAVPPAPDAGSTFRLATAGQAEFAACPDTVMWVTSTAFEQLQAVPLTGEHTGDVVGRTRMPGAPCAIDADDSLALVLVTRAPAGAAAATPRPAAVLVYDVRDARAPAWRGTVPLGTDFVPSGCAIARAGTRAYVAVGGRVLRLDLDAAEPARSIVTDTGCPGTDVAISGKQVMAIDGGNTLRSWDVAGAAPRVRSVRLPVAVSHLAAGGAGVFLVAAASREVLWLDGSLRGAPRRLQPRLEANDVASTPAGDCVAWNAARVYTLGREAARVPERFRGEPGVEIVVHRADVSLALSPYQVRHGRWLLGAGMLPFTVGTGPDPAHEGRMGWLSLGMAASVVPLSLLSSFLQPNNEYAGFYGLAVLYPNFLLNDRIAYRVLGRGGEDASGLALSLECAARSDVFAPRTRAMYLRYEPAVGIAIEQARVAGSPLRSALRIGLAGRVDLSARDPVVGYRPSWMVALDFRAGD